MATYISRLSGVISCTENLILNYGNDPFVAVAPLSQLPTDPT